MNDINHPADLPHAVLFVHASALRTWYRQCRYGKREVTREKHYVKLREPVARAIIRTFHIQGCLLDINVAVGNPGRSAERHYR